MQLIDNYKLLRILDQVLGSAARWEESIPRLHLNAVPH